MVAEQKSLNVFFAVDRNYLIHFTVTLASLLENNKDLNICVYIVYDFDEHVEIERIMAFYKAKYDVQLKLIFVDNSVFNNFQSAPYISRAAYFRLLFADILPSDILSGLYMDCDVVITSSLKELCELSFENKENIENDYSLLAVSDKNEKNEIVRLKNLGILTNMYFNSGVLFINLQRWRNDKTSEKLIKIADTYKNELLWGDQDVLNIFFKNRCGKINDTYNKFTSEILPVTPKIIHYSGSSKPWHYFNKHPYKFLYWKYLKLTPFKDEKFEKVTLKKFIKKYIQFAIF